MAFLYASIVCCTATDYFIAVVAHARRDFSESVNSPLLMPCNRCLPANVIYFKVHTRLFTVSEGGGVRDRRIICSCELQFIAAAWLSFLFGT